MKMCHRLYNANIIADRLLSRLVSYSFVSQAVSVNYGLKGILSAENNHLPHHGQLPTVLKRGASCPILRD